MYLLKYFLIFAIFVYVTALMMTKKIIFNGHVLSAQGLLEQASIGVVSGKIVAVGCVDEWGDDVERIDAKGLFVAPGFIDLHVHGGGGADFMDGTVDAFLRVAETHVQFGTTALSPTTLTSELGGLFRILDAYAAANKCNTKGAAFIGIHLEGPYFSMQQRGAQDPAFIRNPDPAEYKKILAYSDDIARWSAAPELPGALEFGRYVKRCGKMLALAHTDATYDEALAGFHAGYRLATHFYSAMSTVTRKDARRIAGTVEAGYLIDEMDVEIIADGIHVPAPLLKLVYKIKGADRIALVTDAMRAAGMDVRESMLGNEHSGLRVIVEDGVAKLPDRTAFAGSIATADRLVRTMIHEGEVPLLDAVKMMTQTPARIAGLLDKKGTLEVGKDADIVLFDKDINIALTMVHGDIKYQKQVF